MANAFIYLLCVDCYHKTFAATTVPVLSPQVDISIFSITIQIFSLAMSKLRKHHSYPLFSFYRYMSCASLAEISFTNSSAVGFQSSFCTSLMFFLDDHRSIPQKTLYFFFFFKSVSHILPQTYCLLFSKTSQNIPIKTLEQS